MIYIPSELAGGTKKNEIIISIDKVVEAKRGTSKMVR
jgi:hypothetical protein